MKSEPSSILETFDVSIEQENTSIIISEVERGQIFTFGASVHRKIGAKLLQIYLMTSVPKNDRL